MADYWHRRHKNDQKIAHMAVQCDTREKERERETEREEIEEEDYEQEEEE
jgi:hypothetical protein